MGRRIAEPGQGLEQRPGESLHDWNVRRHCDAAFCREKAARMGHQPRRRRYLLDRAAAIEAAQQVGPWHLSDETGVRAV